MSRTKRWFTLVVVIILLASMIATGILVVTRAEETENTETAAVSETVPEISLDGAVEIHLADGQTAVSRDGIDMTAEQSEEAGVLAEDGILKISEEGTYVLSGAWTGGIEVTSSKKKEVTLVLNGLTVENPDGDALDVKKTGTLVIYLQDGTENVLTSGTEVTIDDTSAAAAVDAQGGVLYSKADTTITGTGSLIVNGYINNGIQCSKSLTAEAGNLQIQAVNNGIKVKDTLCINGGALTILSGNDGIHAEQIAHDAIEEVRDETTGEIITEAEDAEEAAGDVIINGGQLNIDAYGDAVQALLNIEVNGGTIQLKTEGEYPEVTGEMGFGPRPGEGWDFDQTAEDTVSVKGLKSDGTITINDGSITIDSVDDALHSEDLVEINGGTLQISTGDDGIHATTEIQINGGDITILTAYEGIEANQIIVNDGNVVINTNDDGFNANGGSMSFGGPGGSRGGSQDVSEEETKGTEMPNLIINGGNIYVRAAGDGLDSNGNLIINGGYIAVDGPEDSWNGALDSGMESGGTLTISGGTIFAGGASSMAETFDSSSTQFSFLCILPATYTAGTEIRILDEAGNELLNHTTRSSGNSVIFSSPELQEGEIYTLYAGENAYTLTISAISGRFNALADGATEEGGSGGSQGGQGGGETPGESQGGQNRGQSQEGQAEGETPDASEGGQAEGEMPGESQNGQANGQMPEDGQNTQTGGQTTDAGQNTNAQPAEDNQA